GREVKGFAMMCREEEKLTGAVSFNIGEGGAYIEALRTDKEEMTYVVFVSALNFLELHGIYDVYTNLKEYEALNRAMKFIPCDEGPIEKKDGYLARVDLKGYFTKEEH
ncbi:MAG: hypothetical protein Q8873_09590, partial [Bacillota bacterium]|nr:hypothetical protein [Bacillota bacterium]